MHGIGPPLVTPFEQNGDIDYEKLRELVGWMESRGVDFLVPCGSNSETELLTNEEHAQVIETVVEEASVPVLAGTGHPGRRETIETTNAAHAAGVDAALVVTPFYYEHDQAQLASYYRELADDSPLPIYLYSVPSYTSIQLEPETVASLASHPNIVGMKDSAGSISTFIRTQQRIEDEEFDLLVGSGSILAQALDAGAVGGVLALANLLPESVAEIYDLRDEPARAREHNADLVELNTAITAIDSIPGLKWAMQERGAPAGSPRAPHDWPDPERRNRLESLLASVLEAE